MEMKDRVGTYDSILPMKDVPREDRVGTLDNEVATNGSYLIKLLLTGPI